MFFSLMVYLYFSVYLLCLRLLRLLLFVEPPFCGAGRGSGGGDASGGGLVVEDVLVDDGNEKNGER